LIKITIKAGYFSALNYKSVWFSFDRDCRNSEIIFYRPYISFFFIKFLKFSYRNSDFFLISMNFSSLGLMKNSVFGQKYSISTWKCKIFDENDPFSCQCVSLEFFPNDVLVKITGHETLVLFPRNQTVPHAWDLNKFGRDHHMTVNWRSACAWSWPWWPWFTSWHWSDDRKYLLS